MGAVCGGAGFDSLDELFYIGCGWGALGTGLLAWHIIIILQFSKQQENSYLLSIIGQKWVREYNSDLCGLEVHKLSWYHSFLGSVPSLTNTDYEFCKIALLCPG